MTIEYNKINGSIVITDIIDNQLIHQTYYGYTKKESVMQFKEYVKEL